MKTKPTKEEPKVASTMPKMKKPLSTTGLMSALSEQKSGAKK